MKEWLFTRWRERKREREIDRDKETERQRDRDLHEFRLNWTRSENLMIDLLAFGYEVMM